MNSKGGEKSDITLQQIEEQFDQQPCFHGGIDDDGSFLLIPLLSFLTQRRSTASKYEAAQGELVFSNGFKKTMQRLEIDFNADDIVRVKFTYPGLTAGIPLPPAAVIDEFVHNGSKAAVDNLGLKRLESFLGNPRCHQFKAWALPLYEDVTGNCEKLLELHKSRHLCLTDPLIATLEAILKLHSLVGAAISQRTLFLLSPWEAERCFDLGEALLYEQSDRSLYKSKWKNYLNDIIASQKSVFQHAAARGAPGRDRHLPPNGFRDKIMKFKGAFH
jgi:hypothetical protein